MCLDHDGAHQGALLRPPVRPQDHGSYVHIRQILALGTLLDDKLSAAQQLLQPSGGVFRHAAVIFKCDLRLQRSQLPHRALSLIALQHPQALGHPLIELFGDAAAIRILGHLEIQQLTPAALPHRQGQDNGDDGVRMIPVAVLDLQLRPGKGPLHRAQQVQVGNVGRRPLLDE